MRPLAAFRPYIENVHTIIVLDETTALNDSQRVAKMLRASVNSTEMGSRKENSRSSAGSSTSSEFFDTVSWVKSRVTETVSHLRTSSDDRSVACNGYVITIGDGYR